MILHFIHFWYSWRVMKTITPAHFILIFHKPQIWRQSIMQQCRQNSSGPANVMKCQWLVTFLTLRVCHCFPLLSVQTGGQSMHVEWGGRGEKKNFNKILFVLRYLEDSNLFATVMLKPEGNLSNLLLSFNKINHEKKICLEMSKTQTMMKRQTAVSHYIKRLQHPWTHKVMEHYPCVRPKRIKLY